MELELVTINLPGGAEAHVFKDVLRKTARLHEAELQKYMTPIDPDSHRVLQSELKAKPLAGAVDYQIDFIAVDANKHKINEIFILNQVHDWSFGPVDYATLEAMVSREQYTKLVEEIDRLYGPSPLPGKH
jgi:hypothetical protein